MRTIIICDDNVLFCNLVEQHLQKQRQVFDINVLKFYDGNELRDYCQDNAFDIIFLDIELGEENGLKIAKELKEINPKCLLIYISSYDTYYEDMVQAEPFHFVHKDPYDMRVFEKELDTALSDAVKRLNNKHLFTFEFNRMRHTVDLEHIEYFYSSAHTIHICGDTGSAPNYYYGKIDDLGNILKKISGDFIRVNKRHIVNMNFIQHIKGNRQVIVAGKAISLAPDYREEFVKIYCEYKKGF